MSFDVFISYSTKDAIVAKAACAALEAAKIRCWIAPRDIVASAKWGASIVRAINKCRVMVLIFSGNANDSAQVQREVDQAFGRGKAVVPLRIEDVKPADELAYYLDTVHWLDALTPPLERNLEKLVATVQALLPTTEPAGPGGEPAIDESAAAQAQDAARAEDQRRAQEPGAGRRAGEKEAQGTKEATDALPKSAQAAQRLAEGNRRTEEEEKLRRVAAEEERRKQERAAQQRAEKERPKRHPSRRAMLIGGGAIGAGAAAAAATVLINRSSVTTPAPQQPAASQPPTGAQRDDKSIRTIQVGQTIESIALAPDGSSVLLGCADGLSLWDLKSGQSRTFETGNGWVLSVALAPDGTKAVSGGYDNKVRIWNVPSGTVSQILEGHDGIVHAVAVAPNGRTLLSVDRDGHARIWELASGKLIRTLVGRLAIAVAPDSVTALIGANEGGGFTLFDVQTGKSIRTFVGPFPRSMAFLPDGRGAIVAGRDESGGELFSLWDLKGGGKIRSFAWHTGDVSDVAVVPNGRQALSASYDKTVKLWDLASGNALHTFVGHTDKVYTVAIAPDGRTALSGGQDGTLRFWNLA
jgi:TIR domain/WD domain, G-beta repeat